MPIYRFVYTHPICELEVAKLIFIYFALFNVDRLVFASFSSIVFLCLYSGWQLK